MTITKSNDYEIHFCDLNKLPSPEQLHKLSQLRQGSDFYETPEDLQLKIKHQPLNVNFYQRSDVDGSVQIGAYLLTRYTRMLSDDWMRCALGLSKNSHGSEYNYEKLNLQFGSVYSWDEINPFHWNIEDFGKGVLSLVYIESMISFRGGNLSFHLIKASLERVYEKYGIRYAVAFGRLPEYDGRPLHDYIDNHVRDDGFHKDWGVRFHQKAGASLVCGIPCCAEGDVESRKNGTLMLYDIESLLNN